MTCTTPNCEYKIEFVATLPDGKEITFPRDKGNPFGTVIILDSNDAVTVI